MGQQWGIVVPIHVREMPFANKKRNESILGLAVDIFAYEPVVWVSVTRPEVIALPPDAPRFLAIVDSGNTVAFNIREDHLLAWTGLKAVDLPPAATAKVTDASGKSAHFKRRQAKIWLHPYPEGTGLGTLDLQIAGGILVYEPLQTGQPAAANLQPVGPHLPLIGARAFFPLKLEVLIDYKNLRVTIGDQDRLP